MTEEATAPADDAILAEGKMAYDSLSYCAWAYDRLQSGDTKAAKELLFMGLKRAKVEDIPPARKRFQTPKASKATVPTGGTSSTPSAPKGGTTARVWVIADAQLDSMGQADVKALRAAIIAACEAEGINKSTAGTQYSKWKRAKGIS